MTDTNPAAHQDNINNDTTTDALPELPAIPDYPELTPESTEQTSTNTLTNSTQQSTSDGPSTPSAMTDTKGAEEIYEHLLKSSWDLSESQINAIIMREAGNTPNVAQVVADVKNKLSQMKPVVDAARSINRTMKSLITSESISNDSISDRLETEIEEYLKKNALQLSTEKLAMLKERLRMGLNSYKGPIDVVQPQPEKQGGFIKKTSTEPVQQAIAVTPTLEGPVSPAPPSAPTTPSTMESKKTGFWQSIKDMF